MTTSIRPPKVAEFTEILRLQKVALKTTRTEPELAAELAGEHVLCRALLKNGRLIGFINAWIVVDTVELTEIAIDPDQQKQGHGRALLQWLLDYAEALRLNRVILEVRDTNLPARSLYESLGFTLDGVRSKYYQNGEDALLYSVGISSGSGAV
jgi:ribosomal-protein-alanine acetyltransferase